MLFINKESTCDLWVKEKNSDQNRRSLWRVKSCKKMVHASDKKLVIIVIDRNVLVNILKVNYEP